MIEETLNLQIPEWKLDESPNTKVNAQCGSNDFDIITNKSAGVRM